MRNLIVLLIFLLISGSVMAQGSPGIVPPVYKKVGDTLIVLSTSGDSVMFYRTGTSTIVRLRGTSTYWTFPGDTLIGTILKATDRVVSPSIQVGQGGGAGSLIFDNFASSATIYSLTGNGLEIISGYLAVTIGATVEGSEITNQTVGKSDIDTTIANMVYAAIFKKTSAVADSAYMTKYYIDHNLFGYAVVGSPAAGQVPVFDGGTSSWGFGSGGSGSGDDIRFDMTAGNTDYVLGATTYPGGYINTSTVWQRGDTGINLVKSGQHPGDTILHQIDWNRVQRNDSTRNVRTFKTESGEYMMIMEDSSAYTKIATGNSGGIKFNQDLSVDSKLRFFGSNREIDSIYAIKGAPNSDDLDLFDSDGIAIQGLGSDAPVHIGSSVNHTFDSDTLRGLGIQSKIFDYGRVTVDTLNAAREKMQAGQFGIITSTDTAALFTRDTANDTTKMTIVGRFQMIADAGLTEFDSAVFHGRLRMYDGTNKSRIDSASQVLADTVKTLPGGYLALQGATSGRTRIRGNASAITSYDITLPAAQGSSSQTLVNDGSGNLSWSSAGGGGNGSADFDSTTTLDSNILKGSGGTILLDVHKNATPSVVIGKGATMTSLIIGGNNSGLSSVDTSLLINSSLYFAAGAGDYDRLDSQRVVNAIRLNRYYFTASDFYWSPEKSNAADKMFLTWNLCDTSATWPNNAYKSELFHLADSVGDSHRPLTITWNASERDSLFSFHWKYSSDSLAGTGSTDTSKMMYPNYALLYVNRTQVDSVFIGKTYASQTADSVNFTDRAIAIGDVVTVQLWFETQVTATSTKRTRCDWAYLNMRRY